MKNFTNAVVRNTKSALRFLANWILCIVFTLISAMYAYYAALLIYFVLFIAFDGIVAFFGIYFLAMCALAAFCAYDSAPKPDTYYTRHFGTVSL